MILLLAALASCTRRDQQLPSSTGRPYEVVLEGDTDSIVTKMLTADVAGLPQPEPMFDIINVKRNTHDRTYPNARLRVVVCMTDASRTLRIKRATDVKAQPQTILNLEASSVEELQTRLRLCAPRIIHLLDSVELSHLASVIKPNPEKQKEVRQRFGIEMKIHESMTASKKGRDFLWVSNNANTGMQSLLVFKFDRLKGKKKREKGMSSERLPLSLDHSEASGISEKVDSILRQNMPGEEDGMYMTLATIENLDEALTTGKVARGLWEMHGDAMGGSYVMRLFPQQEYVLVVMGFVYAPEIKKRNLTKQLEAMLTTIGHNTSR